MNMTILKQIVLLRKRPLIALAVVCAVALALQFFITFYQNPRVDSLLAESAQLREQEGRGAVLQNRETVYRNGLADLAKFREKVYPKHQFARFIGELYEMASKNGLELTSITYKPSLSKEDRLLNYALVLTVSGTYSQLKRFIHDLGSGNSTIMVIDAIAMTATGATAESVQLQLSMTSLFTMEGQ